MEAELNLTDSATLDELLAQPHWMMFLPSTARDAMSQFPELNKEEAFQRLIGKPKQFLFVLHYANRMSRAMTLHDDRDRIKYALGLAYGKNVPKDIEKDYLNHKWGQDISAAINVMRNYDPMPRMLLKMTTIKVMQRVKRILDMPPPKGDDWEENDRFFRATKTGMALLEELRPLTEPGAYGIVAQTSEQLRAEGAMMERLHAKRS